MDKLFLGTQVRTYREKRGYSQELFAEKINLSQVHTGYIERGMRLPSLDSLSRISTVLEVPVDVLINGESLADVSVRMKMINTKIVALGTEKATEVLEMFETIVDVAKKYTKV